MSVTSSGVNRTNTSSASAAVVPVIAIVPLTASFSKVMLSDTCAMEASAPKLIDPCTVSASPTAAVPITDSESPEIPPEEPSCPADKVPMTETLPLNSADTPVRSPVTLRSVKASVPVVSAPETERLAKLPAPEKERPEPVRVPATLRASDNVTAPVTARVLPMVTAALNALVPMTERSPVRPLLPPTFKASVMVASLLISKSAAVSCPAMP